MTLREAYSEWSAVKAYKAMAAIYQEAFTACLMERFGDTALEAFTDQFIKQAFDTCKADKFFQAYAATALQHLLGWVRCERKDPAYKETVFEKRGYTFLVSTPDYMQSVTLIHVRDITTDESYGFDICHRLLCEEGFNPRVFMRQMRLVEVQYFNRIYKGIGLCNKSGGIEFYDSEMPFAPVTVGKSDIVYIPQLSTGRSTSCCLFADILDCFGYQTMLMEKQEGYVENCDYIIMNTPGNFGSLIVDSDLYEKIYLLFPDTDYGRVARLTLQHRNKNAVDLSHLFSGYSSLTDMIRHRTVTD